MKRREMLAVRLRALLRQPDARWCLGLAAAALLTRALFHTRYAYSWDVADFILATRQFDLRLHLPHPLGYILWVMMGRMALPLGIDPHATFLAWNAACGAAGVVLLYLLALHMWDRPTAVVAGLLLLTSPCAWFYAGTGYADIWDATLGTAMALLVWHQRRRSSIALALGATLVYSFAAGVRQQNILFLFPLWIMVLAPLAWKQRVEAALMMLIVTAAWAKALTDGAGGVAGYLLVVRQHTRSGLEGYSWSSGADFLKTGAAAVYVLAGIQLGVTLAFVAIPLYLWNRRQAWMGFRWWRDPRAQLLVAWAAPSLLFLLVVHLDVRPGLTLGMLPPVILLTAAACTHIRIPPDRLLGENTLRKLAFVGVAINLVLFLAPMPGPRPTPTSWHEMAEHDRRQASEYAAIRARFDPASTLLISNSSWYWYSSRQAAVYLRDFESWYVGGPNALRWWSTWYDRTWMLPDLHLASRIRTLVFIHDPRAVPPGSTQMEVDPALERCEPLPAGAYLCWMPVGPERRDLIYTTAWRGAHPEGSPVLPVPR